MSRFTLRDAQSLLDAFHGNRKAVSCYADLTVQEGFQPSYRNPLQARAEALRKGTGHDPHARDELEKNLNAIRSALDAMAQDGARWGAVFSTDEGLRTWAVPIDTPVETELVLGRGPYLVPLLIAAARWREYLVVHTDNGRGRLFASTPSAARLVHEVKGDVPHYQHSSGERHGYAQAAISRHRADHILHYQKELVRVINETWQEGHYSGLVLLGEHEVLQHLRGALPLSLAGQVLHQAPASWFETPAEACVTIRGLAEEVFDAQEAKTASEVQELVREGKAAGGKYAVLDALQSGRLGEAGHGYIVVGPDTRETAGRCGACRTLVPDPQQPCPRCRTACETVGLWQEVLLAALRHRITTLFVGAAQQLRSHGSMAAVLPRS